MKDPKLVARLAKVGGLTKPMTPAEFGEPVADETEKWRRAVEFAGVSLDQARDCRIAIGPVNDAGTVAGRLRAAAPRRGL